MMGSTRGFVFSVLICFLTSCGDRSNRPTELFVGENAEPCSQDSTARVYRITGTEEDSTKRRVEDFIRRQPQVFNTEVCAASVKDGAGYVEVAVPSAAQPVMGFLADAGVLQFRPVLQELPADAPLGEPTDSEVLSADDGRRYVLGPATKPAPHPTSAIAEIDSATGTWTVRVEFAGANAALFDRIAGENITKQLAIVLDGRVLTAPVIQSARFNGSANISGSFPESETKALAAALRADQTAGPLIVTPRSFPAP